MTSTTPPSITTPVRLTRRGRISLVLLIALMAFVLGAFGAMSAIASPAGAPAGWTQQVVQPGDTLWQIASFADPQADPRSTMAQIRQVNELAQSGLTVGQQLWLPVGPDTPNTP